MNTRLEGPEQGHFENYGLQGFPTILILDHDGEVLHGKRARFRPSSEKTLNSALTKVLPLFEARAVAARPDATPVQRANALMTEATIKPSGVDWKTVLKAAEVKGADPKLVREVRQLSGRQPFAKIFNSYRKAYESAADKKAKGTARRAATEATYALLKENKGVTDPTDELYLAFVVLAFDGAAVAGDRVRAETLAKDFEKVFPNRTRVIKDMTDKLEKLSGG